MQWPLNNVCNALQLNEQTEKEDDEDTMENDKNTEENDKDTKENDIDTTEPQAMQCKDMNAKVSY